MLIRQTRLISRATAERVMTPNVIQTQILDPRVPRWVPRTFGSAFKRAIANSSGTATKPQITAVHTRALIMFMRGSSPRRAPG
jgi:hypothetical protein